MDSLEFDKKVQDVAFSRNFGFWSEEEQEKLARSKIAIAGVGGDGFQLGQKLAMMGVGHIIVADPETFERENSNRVPGALVKNYGKNKAEVFRDMVGEMRPEVKVDIFTEGVSCDNVEYFMNGADLVLDESELTHMELGAMIAREARKQKIPDLLVMNIGFSAIATSFHFDGNRTFERLMGIPIDASLEDIANMNVDFCKCLPYMPNYSDVNTLFSIQNGASLPSISAGVDVASAIGTTEAFLHLTKGQNHRKQPTWSPHFRYIDAYNNKSGIVRPAHYWLSLASMAVRSSLNLNPAASYMEKDIENRTHIK